MECNLSDDVGSSVYSIQVEEWLDRALANPGWGSLFPNAMLHNLVAPISDHSPLLLDTSSIMKSAMRQWFWFENKWTEEPDIHNVISRSWRGFHDFGLLKQLSATSDVLETWGKHIATV